MLLSPANPMENCDHDKSGGTRANSELSALTFRIREAIDALGGPTAVAKASGIHLGSLNHYIQGREPRALTIAKIAKACRVRLDWLASGTGEMKEGTKYSNAEDQSPLKPPPANDIDLAALEKAMMVVDMVVTTAGRDYNVRQRAAMLRNAYRELTAPDADLPPLPHFTPRHQ
jgi:hypothetical protein